MTNEQAGRLIELFEEVLANGDREQVAVAVRLEDAAASATRAAERLEAAAARAERASEGMSAAALLAGRGR